MFRLKCFCHTFLSFLFLLSFCLATAYIDAQPRFQQRKPVSDSLDDQKSQVQNFAESQQRQLALEKTSTKQTDSSFILIVTFNIPVNPKTITPSTISINSIPLDSSVSIKFNRVGNEVHIFIPMDKIHELDSKGKKKLFVHIDKITAYDGVKIDGRSIENLEFTVTYQ